MCHVSGLFCDREGLPEPVGQCRRGYYCPEGQVAATPANYTCPEGHYCPTGSGNPTPCPSGTYQVSGSRLNIKRLCWLENKSFCISMSVWQMPITFEDGLL